MLLMENVILAVVPIRESCCLAACLLYWLWRTSHFFVFWHSLYCSLLSEVNFIRSRKLHLVRVNDLGLFLEVESVLVTFDLSLLQLAMIVLSVVGEQCAWIWVSHKSVCAPCLSCSLVTNWHGGD